MHIPSRSVTHTCTAAPTIPKHGAKALTSLPSKAARAEGAVTTISLAPLPFPTNTIRTCVLIMPRPRCLAQSSLRSRIGWLLLRLDAFTLLRLLPVRGLCFMHVCARVRVCTCLCVCKLLWIDSTCISMLLVSVKGHYTHVCLSTIRTHTRAHTHINIHIHIRVCVSTILMRTCTYDCVHQRALSLQ